MAKKKTQDLTIRKAPKYLTFIPAEFKGTLVRIPTLDEIPYIYLCGGTVTLLTARWIGRLSDRVGKRKMFQRMLLLAIVPMTITTLMQPAPLPLVLMVFVGFFFCMNARMIPGMAMLTSAANPALRGTFMTLNSAVQSAAMGLAALAGVTDGDVLLSIKQHIAVLCFKNQS